VVTYRILSQNHNYKVEHHDFLEELWNQLAIEAKYLGISLDNKIAFKCQIISKPLGDLFEEQSFIYIGKYDGLVHVGFGVYQPDRYTKQYNKTFE
jgi:hypothetical protein